MIELHLSGKVSGQEKEYLAGKGKGKYSWADMTCYPWAAISERSGIEKEELEKRTHFQAWVSRIGDRRMLLLVITRVWLKLVSTSSAAVKEGCSSKYDLPK